MSHEKMRSHEQQRQIREAMGSEIGAPNDYPASKEDVLRGAIREAAEWLHQGAPGRALAVLESAMKL